MFLGTHQDNMDDMVNKGRQAKGQRIATAMLTFEQVTEIRRRYRSGDNRRGISRDFGISQGYLWKLCNGQYRQDA
jgi:hypothetical protein